MNTKTLSTSSSLTRALDWLHHIEDWLLAGLVILLVILAGSQIILRDFFDSGISWADPLMRDLVLWTGMLGALAAVRDDKHIALDVLQRFLSPRTQRSVRIVTLGFASVLCAAMAWYSYALVQIDFGGNSAGALTQIPAWVPEAILPVAFGLMALRFALRAFSPPARIPELLHAPVEPQTGPSRIGSSQTGTDRP
jgi:TRAP-type C4-dicarboxylate transport system permease small subunit